MVTEVITLRPDASYAEAAALFASRGISGAPVVDALGEVVGMVSEKDLFRILYPWYRSFYEHPEMYLDFESREHKADDVADRRVASFMSHPVVTVDHQTPILKAGAIMIARHIHHLPVVSEGQLLGMVDRTNIFRTILAENRVGAR